MVLLFVVCGWREEAVAGVCRRAYSVHSTYVFFVTRATIWGKIVKPAVLSRQYSMKFTTSCCKSWQLWLGFHSPLPFLCCTLKIDVDLCVRTTYRNVLSLYWLLVQADRGFATSRLSTDEDGTILVHTLHSSDWYIKKGGERSAGYG
jgi:hypothetical protein